MAKLPDLFVNAVSTWDGKALGKGQKQIGGFEKSVKNLAKAFGLTFSVTAITAFGKASVKAFAEDEAAAAKLTRTVNNLGLGFENARITKFISDLEQTAAVSDDVLRPAFSSLLTTTGSVEKSQKLLALALDISAGSGEDVATVAGDLSAAYVGQTKSLGKYRLGLTKAELAGKSFNEIQDLLNKQFSGQNADRLETYAGRMTALSVAADNAKEIIGKGLIDALSKLGDNDSVTDLADSMEDVADYTADVIRGIGVLAAKLKGLPGLSILDPQMIPLLPAWLSFFNSLGKVGPQPFTTPMTISGSTDAATKEAKARAAAEAAAAKRQKELLALQKKAALAEKNKLSLSKAAAVFDSERISIAAALKSTYDKETRLRLEALMAIAEDDGATALARIGELARFQKNADLEKLAGLNTISSATLEAINTQLLTELKAINESKMAEKDKEIARNLAFGKYNAAIILAGELADKASYSERVQIQLTEIARLASLSKTENAAITLTNLREQAELNMIDRVKAAQKAADDARLAALSAYIALLGSVGSASLGTAVAPPPAIGGGLSGAVLQQVQDIIALKKIATPGSQADFRLSESLGNLTMFDKPNIPQQYGPGAFDRDITVNVNAGVIGNEDTVVQAVQDAILTINRRGGSTQVAGVI